MRIGVIGYKGDLGSQLYGRIQKHGLDVIGSDILDDAFLKPDDVIQQCDITHITAPLEKLPVIAPDGWGDKIVILHDSVMATSQSYNVKFCDQKASVVHMLMNRHDTVVVAQSTSHYHDVIRHFDLLGYSVQTLAVVEHDTVMAQSQAPLALLSQVIHERLQNYADRGLLTASGMELFEALNARVSRWTPETLHSLMKNPELRKLVHEMFSLVDSAQG